MKISYKQQAEHTIVNDACEVIRSQITADDIDFVIVKIHGRYPLENYSINQACKEIIYVNEGKGKVNVSDEDYEFSAGDLILIEAGEKFYWEGNMTLYVSSRPAWFSEQHISVE